MPILDEVVSSEDEEEHHRSESEEDELGREEFFGTRNLLHFPSSAAVFCPFDAH